MHHHCCQCSHTIMSSVIHSLPSSSQFSNPWLTYLSHFCYCYYNFFSAFFNNIKFSSSILKFRSLSEFHRLVCSSYLLRWASLKMLKFFLHYCQLEDPLILMYMNTLKFVNDSFVHGLKKCHDIWCKKHDIKSHYLFCLTCRLEIGLENCL